MTQTQLDQYRYRPAETPIAGPSCISNAATTTTVTAAAALTQDFSDLLLPLANFFAPLTPDQNDPPVDDTTADYQLPHSQNSQRHPNPRTLDQFPW